MTAFDEKTPDNQAGEHLPCIHVQDDAIVRAAYGINPQDDENSEVWKSVQYSLHLGDADPELERFWQTDGTLAKVVYFDQGNGWSHIHQVETQNEDAGKEFSDRLWQEILFNADNFQQNRTMLEGLVNHCGNAGTSACHCAAMLEKTSAG